MPSTSPTASPASARAARHASVARVSSLRPELFENSVAPMPTTAVRSWCCQWSERNVHHRLVEDLLRVLAQEGRAREGRGGGGREAVGGAGVAGTVDVDEELAGPQVLVAQHVLGRVEDPDGQAAALPLPVGLVRVLQQEQDLDELLHVGELLLPVRDLGV